MNLNPIFYQLFDPVSSTYTYLVADPKSRRAIIIDPVLEMVDRDLNLLKELELKLELILETHIHADHITGAARLRQVTGAKIGVAAVAQAKGVDLPLKDGQVLRAGDLELKVLATPGHTDSCLSFYGHGKVFSGDALMIRLAGRTDFQQGSSDRLYQSVHNQLFTLPDETEVYPAHDYKGLSHSTIGLEKKFNLRFGGGKSSQEFAAIMAGLDLPPPKRIQEAVPANLRLGEIKESAVLTPRSNGDVPEIDPETIQKNLNQGFRLIDVRRPDEFNGELGHIAGAELVTLGPDLMQFLESANKDEEIVFVCRSGGRSAQATSLSRSFGFQRTMNMVGGMLRWKDLGFAADRD